jgi:hypothetical protein
MANSGGKRLILSYNLRLKLASGLFPSGDYGSLATGIEKEKRGSWLKERFGHLNVGKTS